MPVDVTSNWRDLGEEVKSVLKGGEPVLALGRASMVGLGEF